MEERNNKIALQGLSAFVQIF